MWLKGLVDMREGMKGRFLKAILVYNGEDVLEVDGVEVLPFKVFCRKLYEGAVF